ncbi:hypothetical protein CLV76_14118 [Marivita geojedonensis]|nr:hypothetical protein CLV76_14118 [Marivita geojedonensis]
MQTGDVIADERRGANRDEFAFEEQLSIETSPVSLVGRGANGKVETKGDDIHHIL